MNSYIAQRWILQFFIFKVSLHKLILILPTYRYFVLLLFFSDYHVINVFLNRPQIEICSVWHY